METKNLTYHQIKKPPISASNIPGMVCYKWSYMDLCAKCISVTKHVRVSQSYLCCADVLNVGQMMDCESADRSLVMKILMCALGFNP